MPKPGKPQRSITGAVVFSEAKAATFCHLRHFQLLADFHIELPFAPISTRIALLALALLAAGIHPLQSKAEMECVA